MKQLPDLSSRLSAVKQDLEAISSGQRYNFTSLKSKITLMSGLYDYELAAGASTTHYLKITATPANGKQLPLALDVRYRVGFQDVMANPGYDSTTRYVVYYRKIPTDAGVHTLDIAYISPTAETVYFKVLATGMDEYVITMNALVI